MPILCSHGVMQIILVASEKACRSCRPATMEGSQGRRSVTPRPHNGHFFRGCSGTAMFRHRAPSPLLSYPFEIGGLSQGIARSKGFVRKGSLLHPFVGSGFGADTTGGGGGPISCTVADTAGCLYECRRGMQCCRDFTAVAFSMLLAIGADAAERASAQRCLGGGGCKLLPPNWGGFGIGALSSLSKR